ncbi:MULTISPECIES: MCE family protein [Streptomyces]|uniref:Virulence factor mce family protein n=1 Tax=Streptomyces venezuelae (strain ATCC 10712 / CBS 650.69 / DSM 40230 / JCM 4526 / NBRC 13096 / PD 04745) TaxID=953739 RepID=F2R9Z3_STRVP|nr:MCE family protein [Streptomyces venezuelae]APE20224.1 ABC transporter substrate-binding protein [Streptomyces venezuelae]QER97625.1 MCE family protein [Streptomyces venezuelae ATCC 10712]QES04813.1 MCE family protein [Streptomyces venezuelae]CCA54093.1 virulence factor mce family protein [Streptomyces venezuelae ATCC 10712]
MSPRPLFKPVKERSPVAVAVVGLLLLALLAALAYNVERLPLVGGGTTYSADFTEAAGLDTGDEVRVAGVKVGEVTEVALDGAKVKVSFEVGDAWVGDRSTAAIAIKTLLGEKYLALDPLGSERQDPRTRIPQSRTTSPYDVTQAFQDLSGTVDAIDTEKLAESFETISDTFKNSPPHVRNAATGLSELSRSVSKRDAELARLLRNSKQFTKTLENKKSSFETLLEDGGSLLGELQKRRDAIRALLKGSRALGTELSGLVGDNDRQLGPTLKALSRVTGVLEKNSGQLEKTLALVGPYYRLVGNTLGSGRWFDSYLCGVVPRTYLPEASQPTTGCQPPKQKATAKGSGE